MGTDSEAEWDGRSDDFTGKDLSAVAQYGGAFNWLHDEPDIYTEEDGEPV